MDLHHRISQHRVRYIIDSYMLMGVEPQSFSQFDAYVDDLFAQYPHGLIEIALVETLTKKWLTIPMEKGVAFLSSAHEQLRRWQAERTASARISVALTPAQFSQITGLDPQVAFASLSENSAQVEQTRHCDAPTTPATVD